MIRNAPRFEVEYVHRDGNRYSLGRYHYLLVAQGVAEAMRRFHPLILRSHLLVLVTDTDDAERGDLSDTDTACDDGMTTTAALPPVCPDCGGPLHS